MKNKIILITYIILIFNMPVVKVPKNDNCSIGVHNGYPVCIKHIMNGSEFSRPKPPKKFSKEYEPTRGIEITEVVVTNGNWVEMEKIPDAVVRSMILKYFEEIALDGMMNLDNPPPSKEDAFGCWVSKIIPKIIKEWNGEVWARIAKDMISKGEIV